MDEEKLRFTQKTEEKEALLVKLAKELGLKPASFLAIEPELRRSSTLSVLATISLSSPVPLPQRLQDKMRRIWFAGLDAGVLKPEDKKDIFD